MQAKTKRILLLGFIVLASSVSIMAWLWYGESGFVHLYQTKVEREVSLERIRILSEENKVLLEEIHRLRTDMDYVESLAREQLNLVKENEVIYRFGTDGVSKESSGKKGRGE
ncbi:MAG TPA: septum formation initiator family protein [Deltaproteobacteria bacterium]|nr:septum formation initiator family protein [Deltaproteobacteria bacterium]